MNESSGQLVSQEAACKIWVHDDTFSKEDVLFNASAFPQIQLADQSLLSLNGRRNSIASDKRPVTSSSYQTSKEQQDPAIKFSAVPKGEKGFVFLAKDCDADTKAKHPNLEVSVSSKIAKLYGFGQHMEGSLVVADKTNYAADHVEICFRDVYMTRADLQRMVSGVLLDQALYEGQIVTFLGTIRATIKAMYVQGRKVRSAYFAKYTKPIFRSESARYVLYIQMSREMWDFDTEGSGEIVFNKVIKSILPELFRRWSDLNARHLVSVVLFTRLEANPESLPGTQISAEKPELSGENVGKQAARDFYRVVVGDMSSGEWETILYELKKEFKSFLRDILTAPSETEATDAPFELHSSSKRNGISARPSPAMEGNILEAINLASARFSSDWLDSDLLRSGLSVIVISPGPGFFEVDQDMLQLTTENLVKNGVGIDLLCLSERPLHEVPVFGFRQKPHSVQNENAGDHHEPDLRLVHTSSINSLETLHPEEANNLPFNGNRDQNTVLPRRWTFVVPQWIQIHFWSSVSDTSLTNRAISSNQTNLVPHFKGNHFVPKCRMYEVQMTGIMENEMSNISIPNLYLDKFHLREKVLQDSNANAVSHARKLSFIDSSPNSRYLTQKLFKATNMQANQRHDQLPKDFEEFGWMDEYDKALFPSYSDPVLNGRSGDNNSRHRKQISAHLENENQANSLSGSPGQPGLRRPSSIHYQTLYKATSQDDRPRSQHTLARRESKESIQSQYRASNVNPLLPFGGRLRAGGKAVASTQYNTEAATFTKAHVEKPNSVSKGEVSGPISKQVRNTLSRNASSSIMSTNSQDSIPGTLRATPMDVPQLFGPKAKLESEKHITDSAGPITHVGKAMKIPLQDSIYGRNVDAKPTLSPDKASDSAKILSAWLPLSNASRPGNMLAGMASNLGWAHTFVKPNQEFGIKWKSICSPAVLPLMSDYVPSEELLQSYEENAHKVTLLDEDLVPDVSSARAYLLSRMILFRLAKGFQLLPVASSRPARSRSPTDIHFGEEYFKEDGVVVYMSKGDTVHTLCGSGSDIQVTRYRPHDCLRSLPTSKLSNLTFRYNPYIKTTFSKGYEAREVAIVALPNQLNWSVIDNFLAGYLENYTETCGFWRGRFVLIPGDPPNSARRPLPALAEDSDDEVHIEGIQRLTQLWYRARYTSTENMESHANLQRNKDVNPNPLGLEFQTRDISAVLTAGLHDFLLQDDRGGVPSTQLFSDREKYRLSKVDLRKIAADLQGEKGIKVQDRRWHFRLHRDCFVGIDLTSWLLYNFQDVSNREEATDAGQSLMEKGLFKHVSGRHKFRDGNYFYTISSEFRISRTESRGWFSRKPEKGSVPSTPHLEASDGSTPPTPSLRSSRVEPAINEAEIEDQPSRSTAKRPSVRLSSVLKCDVDPRRRSDRPELLSIHYDRLYNPDSCYHFRLEWMDTTPKLVEDALASWASTAERYGLRLVQLPIAEACTIIDSNPFRSPYVIELAIPPPTSKVKQSAEALMSSPIPQSNDKGHYFLFHRAILRKFGFVLDVEAASNFPADVDITFSWGRQKLYKYSQYIHKTGVLLAQVTDSGEFLLLANRLAANRSTLARDAARYDKRENRDDRNPQSQASSTSTGQQDFSRTARPGSSGVPRRSILTSPTIPAGRKREQSILAQQGEDKDSKAAVPTAEQLRDEMEAFCSDPVALAAFYDELSGRDATISARSTPILVGRDSALLQHGNGSNRSTPMLDAAIPKLELPTVSKFELSPRLHSSLAEELLDATLEDEPDEAG